MAELEKEEKEKGWYYAQLQNLTKRIDSLPLTENVSVSSGTFTNSTVLKLHCAKKSTSKAECMLGIVVFMTVMFVPVHSADRHEPATAGV